MAEITPAEHKAYLLDLLDRIDNRPAGNSGILGQSKDIIEVLSHLSPLITTLIAVDSVEQCGDLYGLKASFYFTLSRKELQEWVTD